MEVVSPYLGAVGQLSACIYFALLLLTCRSTLLTFPALRDEYTYILLALKMKKKKNQGSVRKRYNFQGHASGYRRSRYVCVGSSFHRPAKVKYVREMRLAEEFVPGCKFKTAIEIAR